MSPLKNATRIHLNNGEEEDRWHVNRWRSGDDDDDQYDDQYADETARREKREEEGCFDKRR